MNSLDFQLLRRLSFCLLLLLTTAAKAQLAVTVSPPKLNGQKAIVPLTIKNGLTVNVESARAVVFVMDDQGKMIAQETQWVIGGSKGKPALSVGATNVFHFVINADKPFPTTNLVPKVIFNRVILEGGKLANPKDIKISQYK